MTTQAQKRTVLLHRYNGYGVTGDYGAVLCSPEGSYDAVRERLLADPTVHLVEQGSAEYEFLMAKKRLDEATREVSAAQEKFSAARRRYPPEEG